MATISDGSVSLRPPVGVARIEQVIAEYAERMIKLYKTRQGTSTDSQIDCPSCRRHRGMEYNRGWRCLYFDCGFEFPKELEPLSPREFEKYLEDLELEAKRQRFAALLERRGIYLKAFPECFLDKIPG